MNRPTTFVDIYTGSHNPLDPDQDTTYDIKSASRVPCGIRITTTFTTIVGELVPRKITSYAGRLSSEVDVRVNDRLRDLDTGLMYVVDEINEKQSSVRATDKTLVLRRVN